MLKINPTSKFLIKNKYQAYLFKAIFVLLCLFYVPLHINAQNTPTGITGTPANSDCPDGAFDFFNWTEVYDESGNAGGDGIAENGTNIIEATFEYTGTDVDVSVSGRIIEMNMQQEVSVPDVLNLSFDVPLENPYLEIDGLESDTDVCLTDCEGNPLTIVINDGSNPDLVTGTAANCITPNDARAGGFVQVIGTVSCISLTAVFTDFERWSVAVGTCIPDVVPPTLPACASCGPDNSYENIKLTNYDAATMMGDVELNGTKIGTSTVLFDDLGVRVDMSGTKFGGFDNDGGTLLFKLDFCDPITVEELEILGLEVESEVTIGTTISGSGSSATLGGMTLTQCAGSTRMAVGPGANEVITDGPGCLANPDGTYTLSSTLVETLYFKYHNPVGGCSYDYVGFKIGTCVAPPLAEVVPTCPLKIVTLTDDIDAYLANPDAPANSFTVLEDAMGFYFNDNSCPAAIPTNMQQAISVSPCAEVVDVQDCAVCEPVPPCATCPMDSEYAFIDLKNYNPATMMGEVELNGLTVGCSEVLFDDLGGRTDMAGTTFGGLDTDGGTLLFKLTFCEPIDVEELEITGLEVESEVTIGTTITGTGASATLGGMTLTQCDGSTRMSVGPAANQVITDGPGCLANPDASYIVAPKTVDCLYFKYQNPAGGCSLDYIGFKIGTCVSTLPEAVPTCPLVLFEITEKDGTTTSTAYQDANGLWFANNICTDPIDMMPTQSIAVSACATTAVIGECEFCCSFEVTCPTDLDLGTYNCNTLSNIPGMPMVITTGGDIRVDNAAGDYQIEIGDTPCGDIIVNTSDDISTPDVCATAGQTITRTVTIFDDENGNGVYDAASEETPVSCNFTINILEDITLPVITCPANVTIECDAGTSPASNGTATATDNCSNTAAITIGFNDSSTQTTAGCGQYDYVITRTWTATDACGNSITCNQIITVEDSTDPVITCPADVTIECDADTSPASNGTATAVDNCASTGEIAITFLDSSTQTAAGCGQYDYVITRTWIATDICGNITTCNQIITVEDSTDPVITCPADITFPCNTDPLPIAQNITEFIAIGGTVSDNCSDLSELTLSVEDSPLYQSMLNFCPGTPEEDRTLTRTYTLTDICGNVTTCEQKFIYLESMVGPIITAVPADQTVDCAVNAIPQLGLFTAVGECVNITYSVSDPVTSGVAGCPGNTIQYTYTATDVCGRTAMHTQTYTLANEVPEFVCPVDICIIECPADAEMIQAQFDSYAGLATVISSCSETSITVTNSFDPNGFIPQNCLNPTIDVENAVAYQIVRFTASDACGRNATCTALVVLKDDNGPEINGTVSVGVADCNDTDLQQGYTTWATSQLNGLSAIDECSGGPVDLTYSPTSPNTDCSSGLATTEVIFSAIDACGNESTILTTYRIIDNGTGEPVMATVSGTLATEMAELIELAEVQIEGVTDNSMMTTTDGYYHFDLMMAQNYAITPSRNDDPLNGITTYDLVLLGQHILEYNLLDSPYKMIAADVNESGSITSLDMIELRRLILQIDSEFTSGKSWTFVDADYLFPNPSNPFLSTFPTSHNINNLTSSQIVDFIGVKLGDLNGTASPNLLQAGDTRSSDGELKIKLEDQLLKAGENYQLEFKASDFKDIAGFQFTLDFAADYLEVMDYERSELTNMSVNNFGFTKANQGKLTVSWNETQSVNMADDATLFQISFTALKEVQLSEVLEINGSVTANEAYQEDLRKDVVLDFGNMISKEGFTLLQNQPNPFKQETVIRFQLPETSEATLTIYDVSGRVVHRQKNTYEAGMHKVMMDKADLGATGVLYYQLSTPKYNDTKKMIVLK